MIRRAVFVLAALGVVLSAEARDIAAGTWELGGGLNAGQWKDSNSTTLPDGSGGFVNTEWVRQDQGAAKVLYYLGKNFGFGVDWSGTHRRGRSVTYLPGSDPVSTNIWQRSRSLGPVLSYNVSAGDESGFKFFLGHSSGEQTGTDLPVLQTTSDRFGLNFANFISKNASVDFGWSYAMNRTKFGVDLAPETKTHEWGLFLGLSVYIR